MKSKKTFRASLLFFLLATIISSFLFFNPALSSSGKDRNYFDKSQSANKVIPRIDDQAASIVRKDRIKEEKREKLTKSQYSMNFWLFIFGAYIFILIFNLSFNFKKSRKLQWFWESFYTFLAIFVWDQLDIKRENHWFPGVVMESGIIIYAFYFYYRNRTSIEK